MAVNLKDKSEARSSLGILRWIFVSVFVGVLVTCGLAFRASAGNGAIQAPVGGGFTQGLADTLYCALSGCTMTGASTYSNVATDITTGTDEALTLVANGTGAIVLNDSVTVNNTMTFSAVTTDITAGTNEELRLFSNGTGDIYVAPGTGGQTVYLNQAGTTYITGVNSATQTEVVGKGNFLKLSNGSNQTGTTAVASLGDSDGFLRVHGGGAFGPNAAAAVTIADDGAGTSPTDTTTPSSSLMSITCNDANGCNYNPGESSLGSTTLWMIFICNVGASNTVTINDTAGVVEVRSGASVALPAGGGCVGAVYTGSIWGING